MANHLIRTYLRVQKMSTNIASIGSFESNISLKKLYPKSSLDIAKNIQVPLSETAGSFTGYIPIKDLDITYSRSSGPGGQHVNKVNTKVDLRFHVMTAKWLPDEVKTALKEKHKNQINVEGFLVVKSERTRSQQLNLADAIDKLRYMIHRSVHVIPPPSYKDLEISRRRQEKATRERLRIKREKALNKRTRQGIDME